MVWDGKIFMIICGKNTEKLLKSGGVIISTIKI